MIINEKRDNYSYNNYDNLYFNILALTTENNSNLFMFCYESSYIHYFSLRIVNCAISNDSLIKRRFIFQICIHIDVRFFTVRLYYLIFVGKFIVDAEPDEFRIYTMNSSYNFQTIILKIVSLIRSFYLYINDNVLLLSLHLLYLSMTLQYFCNFYSFREFYEPRAL